MCLTDGSLLIAGGMVAGGYNNAPSTDNPTMEFFPPKGNGFQFYSAFLHDAVSSAAGSPAARQRS